MRENYDATGRKEGKRTKGREFDTRWVQVFPEERRLEAEAGAREVPRKTADPTRRRRLDPSERCILTYNRHGLLPCVLSFTFGGK